MPLGVTIASNIFMMHFTIDDKTRLFFTDSILNQACAAASFYRTVDASFLPERALTE
jgi:hypothetical protein